MKRTAVRLCILFAMMGCEKTLNIQTDQLAPKIVVDAQIEEQQPPVVVLSNSLDYFSSISASLLQSTFIHNAKITVSDSLRTVTLKEFRSLNGDSTVWYYSIDPFALNPLLGVQGKKYSLHIVAGSQTVDAVTTIPVLAKKIDSLSWKALTNISDTPGIALMATITDPPGYGNYIRYFTRINRQQFLPGITSVFDDQITDGTTYTIQVNEGADKNKLNLRAFDDQNYQGFRKGDTLTVKFCNIDKATFDFWRTWEYQYQSTGNPFSSPGKVLGNISNGGLGAFCGYSVQYTSIIIPK